jgi:small subunit ribosomal protein S20
VEKKDAEASQKALVEAYRLLDRAAVKGVIHRNSAARHKSRLATRVSALQAAPPPAAKA